jgi:hypothetical protein
MTHMNTDCTAQNQAMKVVIAVLIQFSLVASSALVVQAAETSPKASYQVAGLLDNLFPSLPGPIETIIKKGGDKLVEDALRQALAGEIPIQDNNHKFYSSAGSLSERPFTPESLDLGSKTSSTKMIPAGDYELEAHFYSTKAYSLNGRGNRYRLAQVQGRMSGALANLYQQVSYDHSVAPNDIQMLAWSIQSGLAYNEMSDTDKAIIDKFIPEQRQYMKGNIIDKITQLSTTIYIASGGQVPHIEQILRDAGSAGEVVQSILAKRREILNNTSNYSTLSARFAPTQDFMLPGGVETTPWGQVNDDLFMRFIAPSGAMNNGTIQIRTTKPIAAKTILEKITNSIGISEASGGQAIQASIVAASKPAVVVAPKPIDITPLKQTAETIIADITGGQITINQGSEGGMKQGMQVNVERSGRQIIDLNTGKVIRVVTSNIGKLEVTEVGQDYSITKIISGTGFKSGDLVKSTN